MHVCDYHYRLNQPQFLPIDCLRVIRSFLPAKDALRMRGVCKALREFSPSEKKLDYLKLSKKLINNYLPIQYKLPFKYFMLKIGRIHQNNKHFRNILFEVRLYPYYEALGELNILLPNSWIIDIYEDYRKPQGIRDITFFIIKDQTKLNHNIRMDIFKIALCGITPDIDMITYFIRNNLIDNTWPLSLLAKYDALLYGWDDSRYHLMKMYPSLFYDSTKPNECCDECKYWRDVR